jgi:hypothetical protein
MYCSMTIAEKDSPTISPVEIFPSRELVRYAQYIVSEQEFEWHGRRHWHRQEPFAQGPDAND